MNLLALDIGDVRIGVAYGNSNTKVTTPLRVCAANDVLNKSKDFTTIIDDYQPEKLIVGLPKSLDGNENKQAQHIKDVAAKISNLYSLQVDFVDERLSSKEAKSLLQQLGLSEKEMRGKIDSVAASLFLETYINAS